MKYAGNTDYERRPIGPCGKVMFAKKDAATKRNYLMRSGQERFLRIYQCDVCPGAWHLTKATAHGGEVFEH